MANRLNSVDVAIVGNIIITQIRSVVAYCYVCYVLSNLVKHDEQIKR